MFLSLIGFIVLAISKNQKLRFAFTHIALAGAGTAGPLMAAWLTDNTPDPATRSIVLGINGWSNIAGVITGQLFKGKYEPLYELPLKVTMGMLAFGTVGFLIMRQVFVMENKKRARIVAGWSREQVSQHNSDEDADVLIRPLQVEEEMLSKHRRGDQKLTFVYGT
jgi:hypothetical protein